MNGLKNVITAVKAHPSIRKLIYTSSFFALGPTDGYVADEGQVTIESAIFVGIVVVVVCYIGPNSVNLDMPGQLLK